MSYDGKNHAKIKLQCKKNLYAVEKESKKVQKQRVEVRSGIPDVQIRNLIFLDESGNNFAIVQLYARALKWKIAKGKKLKKQEKDISVLAAL